MLRRLRARAIDGATMLARYLDVRRERDGLRETVDYVCDERDEARRERDEYARLVATREVEFDELLRLRRDAERSQEYVRGTSEAIRERDELRRQELRRQELDRECQTYADAFLASQARVWAAEAEVDRLTAERDEQAQGVSVLACRIDRVQQERDRLRDLLDAAERQRDAAKDGSDEYRRQVSALLRRDDQIRQQRDQLRAEVDQLTAERDAAIRERDARIPLDIEDAEKWLCANGAKISRVRGTWCIPPAWPGAAYWNGTRAEVVAESFRRKLRRNPMIDP